MDWQGTASKEAQALQARQQLFEGVCALAEPHPDTYVAPSSPKEGAQQ
jgi:hypothetical protein